MLERRGHAHRLPKLPRRWICVLIRRSAAAGGPRAPVHATNAPILRALQARAKLVLFKSQQKAAALSSSPAESYMPYACLFLEVLGKMHVVSAAAPFDDHPDSAKKSAHSFHQRVFGAAILPAAGCLEFMQTWDLPKDAAGLSLCGLK